MTLLVFLVAGVGITNIIVNSDICKPLRDFLDNGNGYDDLRRNFFGMLITCPMCVGYWVGVFLSILFTSPSIDIAVDFVHFGGNFEYIADLIFSRLLVDAPMVSVSAWFFHIFITMIKNKGFYYESKDLHIGLMVKQDEEKQKKHSTDKELLND